jgi:ABC-2 type transport system permease protein
MAEQVALAGRTIAVRPSLLSRVYGLGSVFGKTLRDQRNALIAVGLLLSAITVGTASQVVAEFDTIESRRLLVAQMDMLPPLFHGLLGQPINIETLPGFISWRLMGFLPILIGAWAIAILSATIAGEAARGTLELVLSTPVSRTRLAVQKVAAISVALLVAMALAALLTWLGSVAFAVLPGDEASLAAVGGEFAYVLGVSLLFGMLAFALAPLLGRGIAAGIAASALFGSYIVNGYADLVPGFDVLRVISPFYWTLQHRPMAGPSDWPALALVFGGAALLAVVGVVLFRRRDLASTVSLPGGARATRLATLTGRFGLAGPTSRSLGELWPAALGWGLGVGLYGLFIAVSAEEFARVLAAIPQMREIFDRFYPGVDMLTAGGLLQLTMFNFASLIVGLAAATLVGAWASDETERRLEILLATPVARVSWALRTGLGVLAAIFVMTLAMGLGVGLGVVLMGDPLSGPLSGALVLGLYGTALAGVGMLVAGLGWPHRAGLAVAVLAISIWLLDFLGAILNLPEHVINLALVRHLGQPMAGLYNELGMLLVAVVALGGLVGGALAFARRDLRG